MKSSQRVVQVLKALLMVIAMVMALPVLAVVVALCLAGVADSHGGIAPIKAEVKA